MLRTTYVLIIAALLAGCAGDRPAKVEPRDATWLQSQLAELKAMQCPQGCDPALWADLKTSLQHTIEQRLDGKQPSSPPVTDLARPHIELNPAGPALSWWLVSPGDYNQDGVVSVSDLTPLGVALGEHVNQNPVSFAVADTLIDGDRNGEINISDLTPLGANLGNSITEWRLYEAADLSAYPASAGDASTLAPVEVRALTDSQASPPTYRRQYIPNAPIDSSKYYWVRGADATGEGIASIAVGGGNLPPVIGLATPDGFSVVPPGSLHFDASGSTDPEGQDLTFIWTFTNGLGYYTPAIDAQFSKEGIYTCMLLVIDEMGASADMLFNVTSSSGEKWRISQPDSAHVLAASDRVRVEQLDNGKPGVGFSTSDGTNDLVLFTAANDPGGATWNSTTQVTLLDGDLRDLDMAMVGTTPTPAMCWVGTGTGSPVDTLECAQATNTTGGGWTLKSVSAGQQFSAPAIGEGDSRVFLAYRDGGAQSLQYAQGSVFNPDPWNIGVIDMSGEGGSTPTVCELGGSPAVAYRYKQDGSYRFVRSTLLAGNVIWGVPVTALGSGDGALNTSLISLDGDVPAFAMYSASDGFLKYVKASDATALVWNPFIFGGTDSGNSACLPAMTLAGGRPFLAYQQPTSGQLFGAWADDQTGTSWQVQEISADVLSDVLSDVIEVQGHPAVAFAGADGTPRFGIYY